MREDRSDQIGSRYKIYCTQETTAVHYNELIATLGWSYVKTWCGLTVVYLVWDVYVLN